MDNLFPFYDLFIGFFKFYEIFLLFIRICIYGSLSSNKRHKKVQGAIS